MMTGFGKIKLLKLLAPIGVLPLVLAGAASAQVQATSVPVCAVVSDPTKFDGKVIQVEGELLVGRHGAAIVDHTCHFARAAAVCIKVTADPLAPRVGFSSDQEPFLAAANLTSAVQNKAYKSTVSLEGQVFASSTGGYCNANSYPVMIVLKSLIAFSLTMLL